jgi:nucleoid-associated protein YgaU
LRSIILIAIGVIAIALALFLALGTDTDEVFTPEKPAPVVAKPAAPVTEKPAEPVKIIANVPPSFDVVRINPQGDIVMAGRATPKAEVTILDSDVVLGTVNADTRGEWVFLPTTPMEAGEHELSLRAKNPDGTVLASSDVVILTVPEAENVTEGALALSLPRDGQGVAKALQVPGAEDLILSIDAVNYDDKGQLSISGKAPENAVVFTYLDDQFLGNATADENGQWAISPSVVVKPGVYKLRADHVDENQKVLNRVSIPFSRASEEMNNIPQERRFVVQPGNSLWRIARSQYGSGFDYTVIYKANQDQISDPDLIYPGQVFELPLDK